MSVGFCTILEMTRRFHIRLCRLKVRPRQHSLVAVRYFVEMKTAKVNTEIRNLWITLYQLLTIIHAL